MTVVLPPTIVYFGEADAPGSGNLAQDLPSQIAFHNNDTLVFHNNDDVVFHETYTGDSGSKTGLGSPAGPRTVYSGEAEV